MCFSLLTRSQSLSSALCLNMPIKKSDKAMIKQNGCGTIQNELFWWQFADMFSINVFDTFYFLQLSKSPDCVKPPIGILS